MGQHHPRPSLEDPGHPHHNVYLVYHSATILRTVYHGQELYPAPCRGNVTSCQTGAVSVQLMHASLLFDTCISADDASLLCIHTSTTAAVSEGWLAIVIPRPPHT